MFDDFFFSSHRTKMFQQYTPHNSIHIELCFRQLFPHGADLFVYAILANKMCTHTHTISSESTGMDRQKYTFLRMLNLGYLFSLQLL